MASYEQRFGLSGNQWQNILTQVRKLSKIEQDQKIFDICFCVSFECYFQTLIFGGET